MKTKEITLKELEKEYGIKFNANPRMKLSTYLEKIGSPHISKAVKLLYKMKLELPKLMR